MSAENESLDVVEMPVDSAFRLTSLPLELLAGTLQRASGRSRAEAQRASALLAAVSRRHGWLQSPNSQSLTVYVNQGVVTALYRQKFHNVDAQGDSLRDILARICRLRWLTLRFYGDAFLTVESAIEALRKSIFEPLTENKRLHPRSVTIEMRNFDKYESGESPLAAALPHTNLTTTSTNGLIGKRILPEIVQLLSKYEGSLAELKLMGSELSCQCGQRWHVDAELQHCLRCWDRALIANVTPGKIACLDLTETITVAAHRQSLLAFLPRFSGSLTRLGLHVSEPVDRQQLVGALDALPLLLRLDLVFSCYGFVAALDDVQSVALSSLEHVTLRPAEQTQMCTHWLCQCQPRKHLPSLTSFPSLRVLDAAESCPNLAEASALVQSALQQASSKTWPRFVAVGTVGTQDRSAVFDQLEGAVVEELSAEEARQAKQRFRGFESHPARNRKQRIELAQACQMWRVCKDGSELYFAVCRL